MAHPCININEQQKILPSAMQSVLLDLKSLSRFESFVFNFPSPFVLFYVFSFSLSLDVTGYWFPTSAHSTITITCFT